MLSLPPAEHNSRSNTYPTSGPLVVILGPTAVGKTEISLDLAEVLDGKIVSADSRLFYRGMDIGTAKPSPAEQNRVPHHLIDVADPDEVWSLAIFQKQARQAIDDILARQRLPFLVGGMGQYIRAVVEGWDLPEVKPDERLRVALEAWGNEIGPEALYEKLARIDPAAASRIEFRNLRRTVRALEVIFRTGKLFSAQSQRSGSPYRIFQLGLIRPREELYARLDARIDAMLAAGFVDEVRHLLDQGYSPESSALSAIGYRQIAAALQGEISMEEAVMLIKRQTRVFVRRQSNWFKMDDPAIHWFRANGGNTEIMAETIRYWLAEHE